MTATQQKNNLHPRNPHRSRYNFQQLIEVTPELAKFVYVNDYQNQTINFADPQAVKLLNQAILKSFYQVKFWDIPQGYLCPPIPGRADYLHYAADLLASSFEGKIPQGKEIRVLDVGVGANCVYPLIGQAEYGWSFVGSEIDAGAIASAQKIIERNHLNQLISIRKQTSAQHLLKGIIAPGEFFHLTLCNPPFHASEAEAREGSQRKLKNLGLKKDVLNFGGQARELWCPGGEFSFVKRLIEESAEFSQQVLWFSSLISKGTNLGPLQKILSKQKVTSMRTIEMSQGQKVSRMLAWSFKQ